MKSVRWLWTILLLTPVLALAQGGGTSYYFVESARLTESKALDFNLNTHLSSLDRALMTKKNDGTPINLAGVSSMRDIRWTVRYGVKPWLEGSLRGALLHDQNSGDARYGATDTRMGFKMGTARPYGGSNMALDVFLQMPTGYDEGERLVRQFSGKQWTWGTNFFLDFNLSRLDFMFNGGYHHNGGTVDELPRAADAFWYHGVDQIFGIDANSGDLVSTSQYRVGLAGQYRLFGQLHLFTEYHTNRLRAKKGDPISIGKMAMGVTYGDQRKTHLKLGMLRSTGTVSGEGQSAGGIFLDLRVNGLFGLMRRGVAPTPPEPPESVPAALPGRRRPFFRRGNTYFAGTRTPSMDTIFMIDISPSMIGRGMQEERGDNVLADLPSFLTVLVDSLQDGSNVGVITYAGGVNTLVWSDVNEDKKEEIRRSVNDIPDIATALAQRYEGGEAANTTKENYAAGLEQAYEELLNFQRGGYNRLHLQRIIHITDDITDDANVTVDKRQVIEEVIRKYKVTRTDFRYYYHMMVHQETGRRVDDYITTFIDREDGKVFREVNFGEQDEYIPKLNFNNAADLPVFTYLSQLTRIAVVPFKTNNLRRIQNDITSAFQSIFNFNEYFVISEDEEVVRMLKTLNIRPGEAVDREERMRLGRRLGVDYVATGEIVDFNVKRDGGFKVPGLNMPQTTLEMKVAVELIDVSDGAVIVADVFEADESMDREWALFSLDPANRIDALSALQEGEVMTNLLQKWAANLREQLFYDVLSMN